MNLEALDSTPAGPATVFPRTEPLRGPAAAQVCVVGASMAGMSAAYEVLRTGRTVIVVDRHGLGDSLRGPSRASWRSDPESGTHPTASAVTRTLADEGRRLAVARLHRIVAEEGIARGRFDGDEPRLRAEEYLAALADAVLHMGGRIFSETEIEAVERPGALRVVTALGVVTCEQLVVVGTERAEASEEPPPWHGLPVLDPRVAPGVLAVTVRSKSDVVEAALAGAMTAVLVAKARPTVLATHGRTHEMARVPWRGEMAAREPTRLRETG